MEKANKTRKRFPFSNKEDKRLIELVNIYGEDDMSVWELIAKKMEGRNARQCRERYKLFLNDGIKKNVKWTKEEDDILLSKYEIYGPHWKIMEEFFIGRTSYSIKNRYSSLRRQLTKEQSLNDSNLSQNNINDQESHYNTHESNENNLNIELTNNYYDFFKDIFNINIDFNEDISFNS